MVKKPAPLGARLRVLRRAKGLTQAALARELGISPSYLNLIEHDRRPLGAGLLLELARLLDVELKQLSSAGDAQLVTQLMEALGDPMFDELDIPTQELREMVTVAPAASRAVAELYRSYLHARDSAESLAVKLSEDASLPTVTRARLPTEQVTAFIQAHLNHFPELEVAADELRGQARLAPDDLLHDLVRHLDRALGVRTHIMRAAEERGAVRRFDPATRVLSLSEALPPSSRAFQIAHEVALLTQHELLERLAASPGLTTDESQALARVILANYFAGAVMMPYQAFRQAAREDRHDIELLQNRFDATFEMVGHRLTTLQRPGDSGIPFHFLRVDIAGNISKAFSASGMALPRFGGSCPRLNVHSAFLTPGLINVQLSRTADGRAWFSIARTISRASRGYHVPRSVMAVGLGCPVEYAAELVYADRVDLGNLAAAVPIGTTCRLCHQLDCEQRVQPPVHEPLRILEHERGHSFYNPTRPSRPG